MEVDVLNIILFSLLYTSAGLLNTPAKRVNGNCYQCVNAAMYIHLYIKPYSLYMSVVCCMRCYCMFKDAITCIVVHSVISPRLNT